MHSRLLVFNPDLNVSYIANIMKRFEELHAYVHFNDNSTVKPKRPRVDRAYKVMYFKMNVF